MEGSDSRKRPLDSESEGGISKRSNQGDGDHMTWNQGDSDKHEDHNLSGVVPLKLLVPSIAAGAIIGKGGDTITMIQKDTGANIKMSKSNDFYPGTTERVCLITGSMDSVQKVFEFISDKIRDKPDPNPKPIDGDLKVNFERHKQIKILVPNSTAGMIIGKAGNFIKQIKDESGAFIQISQKSKDVNLPERCVTIAGDSDQNRHAMNMLMHKIMEDPQSGSCPNISYSDYKGPVASSNPTGSPYANIPMMGGPGPGGYGGSPSPQQQQQHQQQQQQHQQQQQQQQHQQQQQQQQQMQQQQQQQMSQQGQMQPQQQQQMPPQGQFGQPNMGNIGTGMGNLHINSNNPAVENLKGTLRVFVFLDVG